MATRSTITFQNSKGARRVYCHFDGYLDWNGKLLLTKFNSKRKIKKLIAFGGISCLNSRIIPSKKSRHSFSKKEDNVSVFYHRDRGDELNFIDKSHSEIYNYVFNKGKWYCAYDESSLYYEIKVKKINGEFIVYRTDNLLKTPLVRFLYK